MTDLVENNPTQENTPNEVAPQVESQESKTQTPDEKRHWFEMRQREKLKRQHAEEEQALNARIQSGELVPGNDDVEELLREKENQIRILEAKQAITANPLYAEHADKITSALQEQKYQSLSVDEVIKLTLADTLIDRTTEATAVATNSPGPGASARDALRNAPNDYRSMDKEDFELFTAKVKSGQI